MDHGVHLSIIPERLVTVAITGAVVLAMSMAGGSANAAGLANGGHDFSINTADGAETCVVCHAASANDPTQTGQLGSSVSFQPLGLPLPDAAAGNGHRNDSVVSFAAGGADSRPCLGCHDGSVAPDSLLHTSGDTGGVSPSLFGMDAVIGRGHPVFVTYDGMVARRKGLFDPAITPSGLGGTIKDDLLVDSQIVCSSCHGVHDQSGRGDFLRISNDGSRLCLTCHDL